MATVISHTSALLIWLANSFNLKGSAEPARLPVHVPMDHDHQAVLDARRQLDDDHLWHPAMMDLLVRQREHVHVMADAVAHCLSKASRLPEGAFFQLSPSLYLASPALAACQVAPALSDRGLISLLSCLLGTYTTCGSAPFGAWEREALVSKQAILDLTSWLPKELGRRRMTKAVSHSFANCRSVAEVKLAMVLMLPTRLGGFNVREGGINVQVDLDEVAASYCDKKVLFYDLGWEQTRTIIEYNGEAAHQDHIADARRTTALKHMGYTVQTIYQEQLENQEYMTNLANDLKHELGQRVREETHEVYQRRHELFKAIRGGGEIWTHELLDRDSSIS